MSAAIDMPVKWRRIPRERFVCWSSITRKFVTTVQRRFRSKFHENSRCANSVPFHDLSRHYTGKSTVVLHFMLQKIVECSFQWCKFRSGMQCVSAHNVINVTWVGDSQPVAV